MPHSDPFYWAVHPSSGCWESWLLRGQGSPRPLFHGEQGLHVPTWKAAQSPELTDDRGWGVWGPEGFPHCYKVRLTLWYNSCSRTPGGIQLRPSSCLATSPAPSCFPCSQSPESTSYINHFKKHPCPRLCLQGTSPRIAS